MAMMHLNLEVSFFHSDGNWRMPDTFTKENYFTDPRLWAELAQTAERGMFDLLFWGEGYGIPSSFEQSIESAVRWGVQWPRHDQSVLIPILAYVTEHIGFVQTTSTSFYHPYHVARFAASMDHVTGGRFGLNLINSGRESDFRNFGFAELPDHGDRYARMQEFVDVCTALWGSIEPGALILDPVTGEFCDPALVHAIDHEGEYFRSAGPLSVLPSPQGRPLLIQAGGSPQGNAFAARNSDVQYAGSGDGPDAWKGMRRQRDLLDAECTRIGRDPSSLKVIFNTYPIVGETVEEAEGIAALMRANVTDEAALSYLSHNTTFDYSTITEATPVAEVVERIEKAGGSRGGEIHAILREQGPDFLVDPTLLADIGRRGIVPAELVGTPGMVADRLQELWERGGGDGFAVNLRPSMRKSVGMFVDRVVPILQERGVFRKAYGDDETLRERLAG